MDEYELVKNLIRVCPLVLIIISDLLLVKYRWYIRLPIVFFIGWAGIIGFTQLFWDYSFHYAPTKEIMAYVGSKDSGPRVGSIFIGWIYSLVILLIVEMARFVITWIKVKASNA